jgi:predicted nucleic acid-binding protein
LQNTPNISSEVIIETYNACLKKLKINELICQQMVSNLLSITNVCNIDSNVILKALFVKEKYKFSFLDCLIIATALQSFCTILYTEDLHHNLVIEGKLTLVNPFLT